MPVQFSLDAPVVYSSITPMIFDKNFSARLNYGNYSSASRFECNRERINNPKKNKKTKKLISVSGSLSFPVNVSVNSEMDNNGYQLIHIQGMPISTPCHEGNESIPLKSVGYPFFLH